MIRISTYGQYLQSLTQIKSGQGALYELSRQLTSGRKADDLAAYGTQTARLVDLRNFVARRESYLKTIDFVEVRVKTYDASLAALDSVAHTVASYLGSANTLDQANDVRLDEKIATAMNEVAFYLNQEMGERHLFSGSRYGTRPVGDLTLLADPAVGPPPAPVASPILADYDTQAPGSDAAAWSKERFTADDGLVVDYGIVSQDPAFQDLAMALRYAKAAVNNPADYDTYMDGAKELIERAIAGLRDLRTGIAEDRLALGTARDVHRTAIHLLRDEQGRIENVDIAEVGTKIQIVQTQLEATYILTRSLAELSLVNFLK